MSELLEYHKDVSQLTMIEIDNLTKKMMELLDEIGCKYEVFYVLENEEETKIKGGDYGNTKERITVPYVFFYNFFQFFADFGKNMTKLRKYIKDNNYTDWLNNTFKKPDTGSSENENIPVGQTDKVNEPEPEIQQPEQEPQTENEPQTEIQTEPEPETELQTEQEQNNTVGQEEEQIQDIPDTKLKTMYVQMVNSKIQEIKVQIKSKMNKYDKSIYKTI